MKPGSRGFFMFVLLFSLSLAVFSCATTENGGDKKIVTVKYEIRAVDAKYNAVYNAVISSLFDLDYSIGYSDWKSGVVIGYKGSAGYGDRVASMEAAKRLNYQGDSEFRDRAPLLAGTSGDLYKQMSPNEIYANISCRDASSSNVKLTTAGSNDPKDPNKEVFDKVWLLIEKHVVREIDPEVRRLEGVACRPSMPNEDKSPRALMRRIISGSGNSSALEWNAKSTQSLYAWNWPEAVRSASIALDLDSGLIGAYLNRAYANYKMNLFEESLKDSNFVLGIDFENVTALNYRALVFSKKGANGKAIEDLNWALKLEPGNSMTHNNLGLVYEKTGESAKAALSYEKACSMGLQTGCNNFRDIKGYAPAEVQRDSPGMIRNDPKVKD